MAAAAQFEGIVKEAMRAGDLSLSELARRSGIERGRWYAWFRGDHAPTPRSLQRAATVLEVPYEALVAPFGAGATRVGPGIVTDPGLAALTAAVNRLAAVLEGRLSAVAEAIEEGIDEDPDPAPEAPGQPRTTPRRSAGARSAE